MNRPTTARSARVSRKKMFSAFRICARPISSKKERTFFFLGFCPPSIRAVWRGFNADYFLGKGFRKTSADLFLNLDVANGKGGDWGGILRLLRCFLLANFGRDYL